MSAIANSAKNINDAKDFTKDYNDNVNYYIKDSILFLQEFQFLRLAAAFVVLGSQ